jgi:hypothetical protein
VSGSGDFWFDSAGKLNGSGSLAIDLRFGERWEAKKSAPDGRDIEVGVFAEMGGYANIQLSGEIADGDLLGIGGAGELGVYGREGIDLTWGDFSYRKGAEGKFPLKIIGEAPGGTDSPSPSSNAESDSMQAPVDTNED